MTAPAEDPRGGERRRFRECAEAFGIEGEYDPACCRFPKSCSPYPYQEAIDAGNVPEDDLEPPAAGRGDTDSGGEVWRPVCGCEQGMGHMDRGCHSYGLCHVQSAERAARPAGDRAQPTQELREALARWLCERRNDGGGWDHEPGRRYWLEDADALLAGPLAALLDAQAAVSRVRDAVTKAGPMMPRAAVRRALDGNW